MRLGVFFDGFSGTAEMLEAARLAEEAGADSLWFAQHMGYREAMIWAAAAASVTRRVRLVPTAISPYLWPPLPVAMSLATLDELAPGRMRLAVSIGNLLNLGESGVTAARPLRAVKEYVEALRVLFTGEAVHKDGALHRLRGAHMEFAKGLDVPLYIASTGPQMLALAGGLGDGILLSAGLTLASCRHCLDLAEAGARARGRDPAALGKAGFINFNVSTDGASAKAALLRKIAFLFRSRGHAENIRSSGLDIDHEAIIAALARRDLDGAARLLPAAAATAFGVAGTPQECRDLLENYLAVGMTEPIIEISGGREEKQLALAVVRELAGR